MITPKIFMSYSHKDERWKDRLMTHLAVLQSQGRVVVWDDRRIEGGDSWLQEFDGAINQADIAVLLVSANFLASDFIIRSEVPSLLKRYQEEGLIIIPIIVRPCIWQRVDWLRKLQVLPKDGHPLSSLMNPDEALASIAASILSALEVVSVRKKEKADDTSRKLIEPYQSHTPGGIEVEESVEFFISHSHDDGDFAELLKLRIEREGFTAWTDLERLSVGVDWRQEIDKAIKDSAALIVIMTPDARQSEYVTYEWAFAWGVGIKVIPIMLKPTQLHPRLETLQHLDFTNRAARPWNQLVKSLKDAKRKIQSQGKEHPQRNNE
jgi:predicted nucleotide-binding protein